MGAVVVSLVVVALASTGSVPDGSGGTRRPSDQLLDVLISLLLVWMAVGSVLLVWLLLLRKGALSETAVARQKRRPWASFVALALFLGMLALFVRFVWADDGNGRSVVDRLLPGRQGTTDARAPDPGAYRPEFATGPVAAIIALVVIALVTWYVADRAHRRRLAAAREPLLPVLADVLEESLDDLEAEEDPRRAVIAAYARMERTLAAYGLPRKPAEAPDEYLQRIFADLEVSRRATSRLTALFTWAKFSGHDVAPEMKEQAIEALTAVREELRAAEIMAEEERLAGLSEFQERTGER
jgi:phosphatidylglycerophosphate synthase